MNTKQRDALQELPPPLQDKWNHLIEYITELGSLAVGFSGGVDSTFLLAAAQEALGDRAIAVTAQDASVPRRELREAEEFCRSRGIRHFVCTVDPMQEEGYRHNSPDRCYYCKRCVFTEVGRVAAEQGIEYLAEGSNMDDLGDYRPGLRAAAELQVTCPLREAELNKQEIRDLSRALGLPTWKKPAFACLASRFVYGEEITVAKLQRIDRAEQFLMDQGFTGVRVRVHGEDVARIEVPPEQIEKLACAPVREAVTAAFTEIGFRFIALDLKGYQSGSMNATLPK